MCYSLAVKLLKTDYVNKNAATADIQQHRHIVNLDYPKIAWIEKDENHNLKYQISNQNQKVLATPHIMFSSNLIG